MKFRKTTAVLFVFVVILPSVGVCEELKTFAHDLGENFSELFSTNNIRPFLFLTVATTASFGFDDKAQEAFGNENDSDAFSEIGHQLGMPYTAAAGLGALYLAGLTTNNQKVKSMSYDLVQGYVIESVIVFGLKPAINRERPDGSDQLSFPSGHSATGFLTATVLNHHYGLKIGIPAYLGAAYISASRLKKNVHYLSDVVAGAGIGYLIAITVTRKHTENQKLLWFPSFSRVPNVGINFEIAFIF